MPCRSAADDSIECIELNFVQYIYECILLLLLWYNNISYGFRFALCSPWVHFKKWIRLQRMSAAHNHTRTGTSVCRSPETFNITHNWIMVSFIKFISNIITLFLLLSFLYHICARTIHMMMMMIVKKIEESVWAENIFFSTSLELGKIKPSFHAMPFILCVAFDCRFGTRNMILYI